jgi:HlyD family secretion protein
MRLVVKISLALAILLGLGFGLRAAVNSYLARRNQPVYRFEDLSRGLLRATINATGRIEPKLKVQIGAFVSGPIIELLVDFNDEVKAGDLLARIDPALYEASVQRDEAALAIANAEVERVSAQLQQARNDERRGMQLFEQDDDFVSDAELDRLRFSRMAIEAQLSLAQSSVKQAQANLLNSQANLDYTQIRAPVDGLLIDKKIDPGQTLAAQFQTPELFVLGVAMRDEMYVYASVDEADIGQIRKAQAAEQPVYFRVDAYRDELFTGRIKEIRLSATETQNVVTYPVVVTAANPELKLLPGMTANLTFQVDQRQDVLRVPWAALRFFPRPEMVRDQDRTLIEGDRSENQQDESNVGSAESPTVQDLVSARREQKRHVWVKDGDKLRAVEVVLGISDYQYAELLQGDLQPGQQVVVGTQTK